MLVGSREGEAVRSVRLGKVIAEFLSEEEALQITERCLRVLKERKSDIVTIIDEVGIDKFKKMLIPNPK